MIYRAIPSYSERISHSWFKDIVVAATKRKRKAVFIPAKEVTSVFFSENIRRAARRLKVKVKMAYSVEGWYIWQVK